MPTLGERLAQIPKAQRAQVLANYKSQGIDLSQFDPNTPFEQVRQWAATLRGVTGAVQGAMTALTKLAPPVQDALPLPTETEAPPTDPQAQGLPPQQPVTPEDVTKGILRGPPPVVFARSAAEGLIKKLPDPKETVRDYAPLMLGLMAGQKMSTIEQLERESPRETAGQKFKREVLDPRWEQPTLDTAQQDIGEQYAGLKYVAKGMLGITDPEEAGRAVGESLIPGLAATTEAAVRWPFKLGHATPFTTALSLLPAARAGGAAMRGARLARGPARTRAGMRLSKSAEFVEDILDPQTGKPRQQATSRETWDTDLAEGVAEGKRINEAEQAGRVTPEQADTLAAEVPTQEAVRDVSPPVSDDRLGSKVGRGIRRGLGGITLLGDPLQAIAGPAGLGLAAALPATAPLAATGAMMLRAKQLGLSLPEYRASLQRLWVDPAAQSTPAQTAVVGEHLYDPLHTKQKIVGLSDELGGRVERGAAPTQTRMREPLTPDTEPTPVPEYGFRREALISPESGRISAAPDVATRAGALSEAQRVTAKAVDSSERLARETEKTLLSIAKEQDKGRQPRQRKMTTIARNYAKVYADVWKAGRTLRDGEPEAIAMMRLENTLRKAREKGDTKVINMTKARIVKFQKAKDSLRRMRATAARVMGDEFAANLDALGEELVRGTREKKVLKGLPDTERGYRLSSGELEVIERLQKEFVRAEDKKIVAAIAAEVNQWMPDSPLAKDPARLEGLFADAMRRESVTRLLSVRARGALTENLANKLLAEQKRYPVAGEAAPTLAERFADSRFVQGLAASKNTTAQKLAQTIQEAAPGKRKQMLRAMIDDYLRDAVNKTTLSGGISNVLFDTPAGRIDVARLAGDIWQSFPERDRRAMSRQAVKDLGRDIAAQVQQAATIESVYRELQRGMVKKPMRGLGPDEHAYQALSVMARGELEPNMFVLPKGTDPKQFVNTALNNLDETTARVNARLPPDGKVTPEQVKQSLLKMEKYVEARSTLQDGVSRRAGLRGSPMGDMQIWARRGYEDSVGTSMDFMQNVRDLGRVASSFQHSKVALTALSAKTAMNNWSSNGMMQATMLGVPLPAIHKGWVNEARQAYLHLKGLDQGESKRITRALMNTGIADSSILLDVGESMFKGSPATGKGKQLLRSGMSAAMDIYKMGDSIPKMFISRKMFQTIERDLKNLEPGRQVTLNLGRGREATIIRRADGQYLLREKSGRPVEVLIGDERLNNVVAQAAVQTAAKTLFDFNDLPLAIKKLGNTRNWMMAFNPFAAWAYKALELPGKKGLVGNVLAFDPSTQYVTDSPALLKTRASRLGRLSLKRAAMAAVNREIARKQASGAMRDMYGWTAGSSQITHDLNEPVEGVDRYHISPSDDFAIQLDAQWRAVMRGLAPFGNYGDIIAKKQAGKTLSAQEKRILALNAKLRAGKLASASDIAGLFFYTGGLLRNVARELEQGNLERAAIAASSLVFGGTAAAAADVALASSMPGKSGLHRRRLLTPEGQKPFYENIDGYMLDRLIGMGYRQAVRGKWVGRFFQGLRPGGRLYKEATKTLKRDLQRAAATGDTATVKRLEAELGRIGEAFGAASAYYEAKYKRDERLLQAARRRKKSMDKQRSQ